MKRHILCAPTVLWAIAFFSHPVAGQVPQLVNYQGRVAVGSPAVNFNGAGQFKFALVDAAGTTTYWSNDGTSSGGSAPTNAVALTVSSGLFSVLLGDTALTNMSALPNAVFSNSDVRLRVWFNDGSNGQQLLSPDQRIAAVGYATMAAGLSLPATNSAGTEGVITQSGTRVLFAKGTENFFAGPSAGKLGITGSYNTGIGSTALAGLTTGNWNTALGSQAFQVGNNAFSNTALGYQALLADTTGSYNTATGVLALGANMSGTANTATGVAALNSTTGSYNVGLGYFAGSNITTPNYNTTLGSYAGTAISSGANNIALGYNAGSALTTGNFNIDIGNNGVAAEANTMRLGTPVNQTRTFIAGIRGVTTGASGALTVFIDSNGQLGTVSSSARYKEDIADMGEASARLQALRPVTFRYKQPYDNGEKPLQFGLIAEEVAQVFPELAVYNDAGEPETVKYQDLAPLLLNEVQKLRTEKDKLKEESAALNARLERLEALVNGRTEQ